MSLREHVFDLQESWSVRQDLSLAFLPPIFLHYLSNNLAFV